MKRLNIFLILFSITLGTLAENHSGMRFAKGSFEQAVDQAKAENKLVFIDFYTQWCGPCLNMAEEVFPLMEVGNLYNTYFVNIKIDAETESGKKLAQKYGVRSYPTFCFINPETLELVHYSSSRQDKETFLYTGKAAITPTLRSTYLEAEYSKGNRETSFLADYAQYLASRYKRKELKLVIDEIVAKPDFSLAKEADWAIFEKHIKGYDTPQYKEVSKNKAKYVALYGVERVDQKLFNELNYCNDFKVFKKVADFKGKEFLVKKNKANEAIKEEDFEKADLLLSELMADPMGFQAELCQFLHFNSRQVFYKDYSTFWVNRCLKYAQYSAYYSPERRDPAIHYDYAKILEYVIKKSLTDPNFSIAQDAIEETGIRTSKYSMRSLKLKAKPKRK
ncbi:thioredoxin family protein [Carboxylicivirga taeanensis]|uniref:thioredoxin family protein n=1 Tax=Carboxylicivirga taeanensis TaxID=1416875 RepID=UPI003F6DF497